MSRVLSEFGTIVGSPNTDIQISVMPVYTSVPLGTIVQYIGITDANYTNGFFYRRGTNGWENALVEDTKTSSEINEQFWNAYYGLIQNCQTTINKDANGNVTSIVEVNPLYNATATTTFATSGSTKTITTTIVPTFGEVDYVKTTTIVTSNNSVVITETYTTQAKE